MPSCFKHCRVWVRPRLIPGQGGPLGGRGGDRGGWMGTHVRFQGRLLGEQGACLAGAVQRREAFPTTGLLLVEVTVQRGFGDAPARLSLGVQHSLTAQEHTCHLAVARGNAGGKRQ